MHPLRLIFPVTIRAPDFWGFLSEITFTPVPHPGWWWEIGPRTSALIEPSIVDKKFRRTRLSWNGKKLEAYEHIGVLRWFGLSSVLIRSNAWPPHFGSGLAIWQKLKPFCQEDDSRQLPWYTVKEQVCWTYPTLRGGEVGFTEILPAEKPGIEIEVAYSYPPLGKKTIQFLSLNQTVLEEICEYPSQGISGWFRGYTKLVSFFKSSYRQTITWPRDYPPDETLRRFVFHRAADLLGSLSLLCQDGLFAGRVVSHYSGHEADSEVVNKAAVILHRFQ